MDLLLRDVLKVASGKTGSFQLVLSVVRSFLTFLLMLLLFLAAFFIAFLFSFISLIVSSLSFCLHRTQDVSSVRPKHVSTLKGQKVPFIASVIPSLVMTQVSEEVETCSPVFSAGSGRTLTSAHNSSAELTV